MSEYLAVKNGLVMSAERAQASLLQSPGSGEAVLTVQKQYRKGKYKGNRTKKEGKGKIVK